MIPRCRPYLMLVALVAFAFSARGYCQAGGTPANNSGWTLVWSDEFNDADGSSVDTTKWTLETGGEGWGNHELEYYTARPQNSYL